ncbi:MAG: XrtA/PEP-CTERM system histidine kinase PrsK [Sphingomicrobium sp.]
MDALIGFWGQALAAVAFAALLMWRVIEPSRQPGQRLLLAAFAMTCAWAWLSAIEPGGGLALYAETARNLVWVGLLYSISAASDERQHGVRLVYGAVAAVIGCQLIVTAFVLLSPGEAVRQTALLLRLTTAAGALVLVHNLYGQAAPATRSHIRFAMLGLAAMWLYDLNYYTVKYLGAESSARLGDWRGVAVALTAPLFALAARDDEGWRIKLSRAASFQSISLLAICCYFALMAVVATALRGSAVDWPAAVMVAMLAVMTVGVMVLLPSVRARAWFKVKLAKHLFEHRYDYRAEWLRFADTLGRSGPGAPELGKRIVKAFADVFDAPGGLLLLCDGGSPPAVAAEWNWPGAIPAPEAVAEAGTLWSAVEGSGRIIEFDALRGGWASAADRTVSVPDWALSDERAWTAIPLSHNQRLIGLVLLAAPDYRRPLDWEDFDLLRTAGRQAASALAEARGQDALATAQRFEEFNRRFAFILHDIKNLVSQLSLVSRNAERHADNPEFRADMVATLKNSVGKMNDLLARLAPHSQGRVQPGTPQPLHPILEAAIAALGSQRKIALTGDMDLWAEVDGSALRQALGHLIQNASEASPPVEPVTVTVSATGREVAIAIADHGCGMDGEFIRNRLFQPFASTKSGGFGIGAFEARSIVAAMGGRLTVESVAGTGSTFTIFVPGADSRSDQQFQDRRKRA